MRLNIEVELSDAGKTFYIGLDAENEGVGNLRTEEIEPGFLLADFNADGKLVGIEVLSASYLDRVPAILRKFGVETTWISWWDFVRAF